MGKRMKDWDAGDFYVAFRSVAERTTDAKFREKFTTLAEAIEPLQREFERQNIRCSLDTAALMAHLDWIASKMGYCEQPHGFEKECDELYRRVGEAIEEVNSLRQGCFT